MLNIIIKRNLIKGMDISQDTLQLLDTEDLSIIFTNKSDLIKVKLILKSKQQQTAPVVVNEEDGESVITNEANGDTEDTDDDSDSESDETALANTLKKLKLKSLTLPVFSNDVEKSLISGTAWSNTQTRHQFINELAVYYTADNLLHSLKNSKQYKVIAQAVLLAYKGIRGVINEICDGENKLVAKHNKCSLKKKKIDSTMGINL
jgi:hypothetical protein